MSSNDKVAWFDYFWCSRMFELERFGEYRRFGSQAEMDADVSAYQCTQLDLAPQYDADGNRQEGVRVCLEESERPAWKRRFYNRILIEDTLRDGTDIFWFKRFRGIDGPTAGNLCEQISHRNLDLLEKHEAAVVIYQHMGVWRAIQQPMGHPSARDSVPPVLDEHARFTLEGLAQRHHDGRIWVTTTQRLMTYLRVRDNLVFDIKPKGKVMRIVISHVDCPVAGCFSPALSDLDGIAFDIEGDYETAVVLDDSNREIAGFTCERQGEGLMVHRPWRKLDYIPSSQM